MEGFFTFREISRLFWENFGPERSEGPKFSQKSREISRKVRNPDNFRFFIKAHFQSRYKRNFVSMDLQLSIRMVLKYVCICFKNVLVQKMILEGFFIFFVKIMKILLHETLKNHFFNVFFSLYKISISDCLYQRRC